MIKVNEIRVVVTFHDISYSRPVAFPVFFTMQVVVGGQVCIVLDLTTFAHLSHAPQKGQAVCKRGK